MNGIIWQVVKYKVHNNLLNIGFSVRTTVLYVESEKIENSNESVKKIPTKTA